MKNIIIISALALLFSCKKDDHNHPPEATNDYAVALSTLGLQKNVAYPCDFYRSGALHNTLVTFKDTGLVGELYQGSPSSIVIFPFTKMDTVRIGKKYDTLALGLESFTGYLYGSRTYIAVKEGDSTVFYIEGLSTSTRFVIHP